MTTEKSKEYKALEKVFDALSNGINWENYDDGDENKSELWRMPEVLNCKIDHVKETLSSITKEDVEEELATLEMLQDVMDAICTFYKKRG